MYLYEKIDVIRETGIINDLLPSYITNNLNPNLELRKYQKQAFHNFLYYFENEKLRTYPSQTLFHMATGSGKTLVMAGLILYLYKQGYRNFLFFVNSTNIITKTKMNFLDKTSPKYLLSPTINIEGKQVKINEVNNFQSENQEDINICFSTIQGLHTTLLTPKENSLTLEDFEKTKIVLISDEAHHINVMTSRGKINKEEQDLLNNWEYTVERIFHANKDNVLLEFTATCDIENEYINEKYMDKMIMNYPLTKFREDGYSKEVETLQSNVDLKTKMLQAVLLSQYRLKIFQDNKLDVKPVILFKSNSIPNSKKNMERFIESMNNLTEEEIREIKMNSSNEILIDMFAYYEEKNIDIKNLLLEIKDDFSKDKCLSVNNDNEAINTQVVVNSLEEKTNKYRAIFEVEKLDEGWDVLNLFDIVRLYETRDGKNGKPGKKTIQEAQLIGRGARYYPFQITKNQNKYIRKYDHDIENPLRICETILYHCQMEPRYISELKVALKETGIIASKETKVTYKIKDSFKKTKFYQEGLIFYNEKRSMNQNKINSLPDKLKYETYDYEYLSGQTKVENLLSETTKHRNIDQKLTTTIYSIANLCQSNYNLVYSAFKNFNLFDFNRLKFYFPNVKSTREFLESENYLGNIKISLKTIEETPTKDMIYKALMATFNTLKDKMMLTEELYEGSCEFFSKKCHEVFKDKICNITNPENDSVGISQSLVEDPSYRLDLSDKDWYIYNDNFGTTEEKKFVKYFSDNIEKLKKNFSEIYLIRNERELPIYTFNTGERFEPDYLLILTEKKSPFNHYQIFIEPKGAKLIHEEEWKEEFLKSLQEKAIPKVTYVDNNNYFIWGFPFFNKDQTIAEFDAYFQKLTKNNQSCEE